MSGPPGHANRNGELASTGSNDLCLDPSSLSSATEIVWRLSDAKDDTTEDVVSDLLQALKWWVSDNLAWLQTLMG